MRYAPLLDLLAEAEGKAAGGDALAEAFRGLRKGARRARLSEDRLAAKLGRADGKRAGAVGAKDLERALERLGVAMDRKARDALAKRFAEKRRSRFSASAGVGYAAVARWALADERAARKRLAAAFEAAPEVARAAAKLGREVEVDAWLDFARRAGLPLCDGELRALAAAWDADGAGAFPARALRKLGAGSDDASSRSSRSRSRSRSRSESQSRAGRGRGRGRGLGRRAAPRTRTPSSPRRRATRCAAGSRGAAAACARPSATPTATARASSTPASCGASSRTRRASTWAGGSSTRCWTSWTPTATAASRTTTSPRSRARRAASATRRTPGASRSCARASRRAPRGRGRPRSTARSARRRTRTRATRRPRPRACGGRSRRSSA